jgi:hypothetical protein
LLRSASTIDFSENVDVENNISNKFENKSCQDQRKQSTLSRTLTRRLWGKDKSVETDRTSIRTLCPNWSSAQESPNTGSPTVFNTLRKILKEWLKVTSLRRLTRSNPQHLPHHHHQDRAGSGSSLSGCCGSRTLTNAPADPETMASRNTRAKSKRIDVAKTVNKYDVDTTVYSKSKRIAPRVTI